MKTLANLGELKMPKDGYRWLVKIINKQEHRRTRLVTSSELSVRQHHRGSGEKRAEDETPFSSSACLHTIIAYKSTADKNCTFV